MEKKKSLTLFEVFCYECLFGLYNPKVTEEEQCNGYKKLKKMVVENIEPASLEEMLRYEENPTKEELCSDPNIKYLRFLHPLLRTYIIINWSNISKLDIS